MITRGGYSSDYEGGGVNLMITRGAYSNDHVGKVL